MVMNYLDIAILIFLLYGMVKGFSNGIIIEISNTISVFLAIYIGVHFSQLVYPYLNLDILSDYSNAIPLIAFLIVFIVIIVIVKSIGELLNRITKQLALGLISRISGVFFGMIKMLIICVFFLFLVVDYELIDKHTQESSILLRPLQNSARIIMPEINKHKNTIIESAKESTEKAKKNLEQKINPE